MWATERLAVVDASLDYEQIADQIYRTHPTGLSKEETVSKLKSIHEKLFLADACVFVVSLEQEFMNPQADITLPLFIQTMQTLRAATHKPKPKGFTIVLSFYDKVRDQLANDFDHEPSRRELTGRFVPFLFQACEGYGISAPEIILAHAEERTQDAQLAYAVQFDNLSQMLLPVYPNAEYDRFLRWISAI